MKKKVLVISAFVIETIVLIIAVLYSSFIFLVNDAKSEWFDEVSPDGNFHVKCYQVGTSLFFSSQNIEVYFGSRAFTFLKDVNSISFKTDIANDGAILKDENYKVEWLKDSVKITFSGEEQSDAVYVIPYYQSNENISYNEEIENAKYEYTYGEVFEISGNTIQYGNVAEDKTSILALEGSDDISVINYENSQITNWNDIKVGDYVTIYKPTQTSDNVKTSIIVAKKDFIIDEVEKQLLNKREFEAELIYYNENEKYIIAQIPLENEKKFGNMISNPMYNFKLNVLDRTETYLGTKSNKLENNYGYHLNELCTIELESNIAYLPNKYTVKSIGFIAD